MDTLYSALLALSLALLACAIVAGALSFSGRTLPHFAALSFALSAIIADIAAFFVHLLTGHVPGTVAPMSFPQFIAEHDSFVIIALAAAALAFFLIWRRSRKIPPPRAQS